MFIKTLEELSKESGIPYDTINRRYHTGWEHDKLTSELLTNETKLITIGEKRILLQSGQKFQD